MSYRPVETSSAGSGFHGLIIVPPALYVKYEHWTIKLKENIKGKMIWLERRLSLKFLPSFSFVDRLTEFSPHLRGGPCFASFSTLLILTVGKKPSCLPHTNKRTIWHNKMGQKECQNSFKQLRNEIFLKESAWQKFVLAL